MNLIYDLGLDELFRPSGQGIDSLMGLGAEFGYDKSPYPFEQWFVIGSVKTSVNGAIRYYADVKFENEVRKNNFESQSWAMLLLFATSKVAFRTNIDLLPVSYYQAHYLNHAQAIPTPALGADPSQRFLDAVDEEQDCIETVLIFCSKIFRKQS